MNAADVYDAQDFQSIKLSLNFENLTTRTAISDKSSVLLVEVGEKSLTLQVPFKSCSPRHSIMLRIERPVTKRVGPQAVNSDKRKREFELLFDATAKVVSVEESGDGQDKVLLELVQFDVQRWSAFLTIFSVRQDEIEKFFTAVKG
jgi:hypothetical protein